MGENWPHFGAPPVQVRTSLDFAMLDIFSRRAGMPINQG